ncbi:O-antigen ligase family protein [Pseudomonas syringae]|uniref:Membrane protein n=1 Tax=Pseudomonas syringae TaxID=317 RepID=A0A085VDS9_PSESX|nr:O-antigen ligase family protein [Pseudomonas syringae]KFE53592.1 membrane protein [Pseudomonas syringae]
MPLAAPVGLLFALLFGVLILLLPPLKVIAAMIGVVAIATVIRKPMRGLLLFGVLAAFLPYSTVNIGFRTTVSEALLMLVWAAYLAHRMFSNLAPLPPLLRTERWLIALMLYSALPFVVGQLTITALGNGPINWIRWLFNLSILFLVPRMLNTQKAREQMILAVLLGTLLLLLLSIPLFLVQRNAQAMIPVLTSLGYGGVDVLAESLTSLADRMGSPWMHPNVAGGAMALVVPLAFCIGMTRTGWVKRLGFAVAILGSLGLLLTGSRGALVSLVLVMMWMARKRVPFIGRVLMGGLIAGSLLLMFYPPLQERLFTLFTNDDTSTAIRFLEYSHFPDAVAMFPMGIGFKIDPPVPGATLFGISNLWLNFVYKLGLPGMLLFIAVIGSWWRETRPEQGFIGLNHDNAVWLGTTTGVLAALTSGLFDHYFSFTSVLIALFWLMLGINLHEAIRLKAEAVLHKALPEQGPQP